MNLGIIGTGNMAQAILAGVTKTQSQTKKPLILRKNIIGFDIDVKRLKAIQKKYGIQIAHSASQVLCESQTVLIAVKPQNKNELVHEIKSSITRKHLVLSILAGIDTHFFEKHLGKKIKVVRLMPNTPALIGLGATVFYKNKNCSVLDKKKTEKIFKGLGEVLEVKKEDLLDGVTGLSGSGPAYVYSFIQAMVDGGVSVGLPREIALDLTLETILGATSFMKISGLAAEKLIGQVASKGGTTEAGLKVLNKKKFRSIVAECIQKATKRAEELRKE